MADLPQRRYMRLEFNADLVLRLTRGRYEVIADGAPKDAALVRACYDEDRMVFVLIVESSDFEPVPQAGDIPAMRPPLIRRLES